jgi:D-alanyl-D-alanine carboxypeptidase
MVEQTVSAAWEETIKKALFEPLGMTGVGFGGVGTTGQIDQPWSHDAKGKPTPANGPAIDNPAVLGPAGTVHATLRDWGKFVADQIRGAQGGKALLKPETYRRLHTPPFSGDYTLGWLRTEKDRSGTTLTHSGSNTMNYAVVWMNLPAAQRTPDVVVDRSNDALRIETPDGLRSPKGGFAVLVVTNQGGPAASKACERAVAALIKIHPVTR